MKDLFGFYKYESTGIKEVIIFFLNKLRVPVLICAIIYYFGWQEFKWGFWLFVVIALFLWDKLMTHWTNKARRTGL